MRKRNYVLPCRRSTLSTIDSKLCGSRLLLTTHNDSSHSPPAACPPLQLIPLEPGSFDIMIRTLGRHADPRRPSPLVHKPSLLEPALKQVTSSRAHHRHLLHVPHNSFCYGYPHSTTVAIVYSYGYHIAHTLLWIEGTNACVSFSGTPDACFSLFGSTRNKVYRDSRQRRCIRFLLPSSCFPTYLVLHT